MKYNLKIIYIYSYVPKGGSETGFEIAHGIPDTKIYEFLDQHNFYLNREYIQELLEQDGAHFYHDSIRLYQENADAFYKLGDDYELCLDKNKLELSLILCIKPRAKNLSKKIDDLSFEMKSLKEDFKKDINKLKNELMNLGNIQKILSNQLLKKYYSQLESNSENTNNLESLMIPSLPNEKSILISPSFSRSQTSGVDAIIDPPNIYEYNREKAKIIDIAVMYSEPLVEEVAKKKISSGDPVDFEDECNKILDALKNKQKHIEAIFEIATYDNLVDVISKKPVILHITCHGEYNSKKGKFYLSFEQNAELFKLYSSNLKDILEKVEAKMKIVFVNACHSEEVANVFHEAMVPCVIAIQSELKIQDEVSQKFAEIFYNKIFDGESIKDAFSIAQVSTKSLDINTCCCAHSHKKHCPWYEIALSGGFANAHLYHMPTCNECPKKNQHIHKEDCSWARDFFIEHTLHDSYINPPNEGEVYTCCCSPELPHDESLKFKMKCLNYKVENSILFPNKEKGKLMIKNTYTCIDQKFPVKRIQGRNVEMYELYKHLTDKKTQFVILYGLEGIGKSSLIKQLANYLYERNFFRDGIHIILLEKTRSDSHFLSDLCKEVGAYDKKSLCATLKKSKTLFILEKCDLLVQECLKDFTELLQYISEQVLSVKFVLIMNDLYGLTIGPWVHMKQLEKLDAAKLLLKNSFYSITNCSLRNPEKLANHAILDLVPRTPQQIWYISERLKRDGDLNKLLEEFQKSHNNAKSLHNDTDDGLAVGSALW